jgi:Fur family ferric uptake transcriptional regulator
MTCTTEFTPLFRQNGYRMTAQRMAILHALRHTGGHLSPAQVYALSRKEFPGLTQPTVYRTLDFLARNGVAISTRLASGRTVYELADRKHHHLVCRSCGANLEVDPAPLGKFYRALESSSGYKLDHGHITFSGLCPQCQGADRS